MTAVDAASWSRVRSRTLSRSSLAESGLSGVPLKSVTSDRKTFPSRIVRVTWLAIGVG